MKNAKTEKRKPDKAKDGLLKRGDVWYVRCKVNGTLYRQAIGKDKSEAEAILAELKKQRALFRITGDFAGLEAVFQPKERKKFAEVADDYLKERPHLKASTKRSYDEIFKNYLMPAFGGMYVDQIKEEQISQFQADISQTVSATRTNNILGPLRYLMKTCLRRGLISRNPALNVKTLREEEPTIDPLSLDELKRVIEALRPYQRPLFITLAWTGARPDELFALKWQDVNFDRNEIYIRRGRVRGSESTTKTRAGNRTIHMFSPTREALLELKEGPTKHVAGYVFLNKHNQPYDKHVDREWRMALVKAGVRHRPGYQLRHTFASMCLQNGLQPTWVAKTLGHSSPQITYKHYARFIDDDSNFNEQRLEQVIEKRLPSAQGGPKVAQINA